MVVGDACSEVSCWGFYLTNRYKGSKEWNGTNYISESQPILQKQNKFPNWYHLIRMFFSKRAMWGFSHNYKCLHVHGGGRQKNTWGPVPNVPNVKHRTCWNTCLVSCIQSTIYEWWLLAVWNSCIFVSSGDNECNLGLFLSVGCLLVLSLIDNLIDICYTCCFFGYWCIIFINV